LALGGPPPPPVERRQPEAAAALAKRLLPEGPVYVGFLPGAGDRRKCWPLDRFIELARAESAKGRLPVFILGPAEADWVDGLAEAVPTARFPLADAAGLGRSTDPLLTVALGGRLAAAVANDSGGAHLIAAGGAAMLSLFGPSAADKFRPMARRLSLLRAHDFGGEAMHLIPLERAAAALDRLLAQA
jgi:ADP-heptose:LPS heptosyltransferase